MELRCFLGASMGLPWEFGGASMHVVPLWEFQQGPVVLPYGTTMGLPHSNGIPTRSHGASSIGLQRYLQAPMCPHGTSMGLRQVTRGGHRAFVGIPLDFHAFSASHGSSMGVSSWRGVPYDFGGTTVVLSWVFHGAS